MKIHSQRLPRWLTRCVRVDTTMRAMHHERKPTQTKLRERVSCQPPIVNFLSVLQYSTRAQFCAWLSGPKCRIHFQSHELLERVSPATAPYPQPKITFGDYLHYFRRSRPGLARDNTTSPKAGNWVASTISVDTPPTLKICFKRAV